MDQPATLSTSLTAERPPRLGAVLSSVWQFARPHTVIGTSLCVAALFTLSRAFTNLDVPHAVGLWGATWIAALAANVYVVGLNQIRDVDVDRVNKPYLPLAAGTMRMATARLVVAACAVVALAIAWVLGTWILVTVVASMAIGSLYSVPPVRLKRFAAGAALAIASVRGPIANIGLFAHFQAAANASIKPTPEVFALTVVMTFFAAAVAVAKDVPDIEGDRQFGLGTLAVRKGPRKALVTGVALLVTGYAAATVAALVSLPGAVAISIGVGHGVALIALAVWWRGVDATDQQSTARFYARMWRLFYAEYVVFPLIVLAASTLGRYPLPGR